MAPPPFRLRDAGVDDAAGVLAIYAPFIESTPITFETEVPPVSSFAERISALTPKWPWLVAEVAVGAEVGGKEGGATAVAGYAYASGHRDRAAYRFSAEVSAYVAPAFHRRGIARALYTAVLELLRRQGIVNVYAGISLPNAKSVGFHEALGFRPLCVYRHVGFKHGAWHDVGWWEQTLNAPAVEPKEPIPASALRGRPEWRAVLDDAARGAAR